MAALKCPNPSCPFVFDPTQVPPGAVLTCPRCAMRFTLGPAAPPRPEGNAPSGDPSLDPAHAPTGTYEQFLPPTGYTHTGDSQPTHADSPPVSPPSTEPDEVPHHYRRGSGIGGTIFAVGGILLLFGFIAAAVVAAGWIKGRFGQGTGTGGGDVNVADMNFGYSMPSYPWEKDAQTQVDMGINAFVLKRAEPPEAWAALAVSNFGNRTPLQKELHDKTYEQLNKVFVDVPLKLNGEPAKWAGHDCQRIQFRAARKGTDVPCAGEVYVLVHKGLAYWFYVWAAEKDVASLVDQFEDLRSRFRLLGLRESWNATRANEIVLRGATGNYRLSTYEKIWTTPKEWADPKDADPKADLRMKGVLKGRGRGDFHPEAELVVMILDGGGDPTTSASKYVRQRKTLDKESAGDTVFTEVTGDPDPDSDAPVGPEKSENAVPVQRLKVGAAKADSFKSLEKLVVYSAVLSGGSIIVAEATCPWSQRAMWERRMVQLVGSLKP